jgi:hypothetical protein
MVAGAAKPTLVPAPVAVAAPAGGAVQPRASDLLLPAVVADRLGVGTKVLERWRGTDTGPAFVRLTRKTLRYRAADVDAFIAGRVCASTAAA